MFLNASALQVFLITFILPLFIQGITIIIGVLIDSSLPFKLLFPLLVLTLIPGILAGYILLEPNFSRESQLKREM